MKFLRKLFLLFNIFFLIRSAGITGCNHDEFQKKFQKHKINLETGPNRFLQNLPWEPIRIYLDYTSFDSQTLVSKDKINQLKATIGQIVDALQILIMVQRSTLPVSITQCDDNISISPEVSTGVDADLILFPYIDPVQDSSTIASAAACVYFSNNNRPAAGVIYFNLREISYVINSPMLILHEVTHLLGFSNGLYDYFIDSSGNIIPKENVITTSIVNGKTVTMIKTPKVLETARKYFNCPNLEGVELEDYGGQSTAGSHWESRIMYGEYMIGFSISEVLISEITLAFLEDMGWYKVNYYTAGLFRFGKNQGCDFLNKKCVQNDQTVFKNEYPINNGYSRTCFAGRSAKGFAKLSTSRKAGDIPEWGQNWSNSNMGGMYSFADYCH